MLRNRLLQHLADLIVSLNLPHPTRVALDGIDAAGKTTLADELAPLIQARGRPVIRASVDGFHRPRHERYQRGADSPEGYYQDAFDYNLLRDRLLSPLGPDGNGQYQSAIFDYRTDTPLIAPLEKAPADAVLLFDGVFLLRPELVGQWDYRIFVSVEMETALQRALHRDLSLFGDAQTIHTRYQLRYFPAQRLYFQVAHPQQQADVIIDNNDPHSPQLLFPPGKRPPQI